MTVTAPDLMSVNDTHSARPCAFTGLAEEGEGWVGHSEAREATWVVRLLAPPAVPRRALLDVCDECKNILTGELIEEAAKSAGFFMECTVIERIGS